MKKGTNGSKTLSSNRVLALLLAFVIVIGVFSDMGTSYAEGEETGVESAVETTETATSEKTAEQIAAEEAEKLAAEKAAAEKAAAEKAEEEKLATEKAAKTEEEKAASEDTQQVQEERSQVEGTPVVEETEEAPVVEEPTEEIPNIEECETCKTVSEDSNQGTENEGPTMSPFTNTETSVLEEDAQIEDETFEIAPEEKLVQVNAIPNVGDYYVNKDGIAVEAKLDGVSTNAHTMPGYVWTDPDGNVKFAVKSTHMIQSVKLNGVTKTPGDVYDPWVNIRVHEFAGNKTLELSPDGLNGSTGKSHWTVVTFPPGTIKYGEGISTNFFVEGIGGGHNVGGTFTIIIPDTHITVDKIWKGSNIPDGVPATIILKRKLVIGSRAGYPEVVEMIDVTSANNYSNTFTLDIANNEGLLYKYFVEETITCPEFSKEVTIGGPEGKIGGYDLDRFSEGKTYKFEVTNTYEKQTIEIPVTKTWKDSENKFDTRPEKIVINLLKNRVIKESIEVTAENNWEWIFEDLPKYENCEEIEYTITEGKVGGYTSEITGDIDTGFKITNTLKTAPIEGTKTWVGGPEPRPEVKLELWRKGGEAGDGEKVVDATLAVDNKVDFGQQPTTDVNGVEYEYYVIEPEVPTNYTKAEAGLNVTNIYESPKKDLIVTKTWVTPEGEETPESVVVDLYRKVGTYAGVIVEKITLTKDADGKYFTKLEELPTHNNNGEPYIYYLVEDKVPGFLEPVMTPSELKLSESTDTIPELVVTNTREKYNLEVEKIWAEDSGLDRPSNLVFILKRGYEADGEDGVEYKRITLTSTDFWKTTFTDLPKYDLTGKEYVYTLDEVLPPGYEKTVVTENSITNTRIVVEIPVTKTWIDTENIEKPEKITFKLYRDGVEVNQAIVGADLNYSHTFKVYRVSDKEYKLPKTNPLTGKDYVYTVKEIADDGKVIESGKIALIGDKEYEVTYDQETHTITNEYLIPGMSVEKTSTETIFDTVGEELNYTVVVTNTGEANLRDVVVEDTLVDLSEITPEKSLEADGILQVGETWTYKYTYTVTQADIDAGKVLNSVSATSPDNPDDEPTDKVEIPADKKPAMTVEKTSTETSFDTVGDVLNYRVVVTNTGNVTLNEVEAKDSLVDLTEIKPVESMTADGKLEVGETWTYTYTYAVTQADIDAGKVLNSVSATSPDNPDDEPTDEVEIPADKKPAITVEKTSDKTEGLLVDDVVNYTVVVTNTGNITINEVEAEDSLVDLSEIEPVESMTADGKLEVGETWTYTYTYTVTQEDVEAGSVLNSVTVVSPEVPDDTPTDEVEIPTEKNPSMTVEKSTDASYFEKVGEELTYTVVVSNTGNIRMKEVVVEDSLVDLSEIEPVESVTSDGILELGETWTYSYTYIVTQADIDAGKVLNSVSATSPDLPDNTPTDEVEITKRPDAEPVMVDPPLKKIVSGDSPSTDGLFKFTLRALSTTAEGITELPMPEGSDGQVKVMEVVGGGEYEFGWMTMTVPGIYEYEMVEETTGLENYTYDDSRYIVRYVIEREGDKLVQTTTITRDDGKVVEIPVFENIYTKAETPPVIEKQEPTPKPEPPVKVVAKEEVKTGDAGILIPIIALMAASFVLIALTRKNKKQEEAE